jgi:hypothetical protein
VVEVRSHHVDVIIDDKAREMLANALSHDARLAVMNRKTLLQQNCTGLGRKSLHTSCKFRFT